MSLNLYVFSCTKLPSSSTLNDSNPIDSVSGPLPVVKVGGVWNCTYAPSWSPFTDSNDVIDSVAVNLYFVGSKI